MATSHFSACLPQSSSESPSSLSCPNTLALRFCLVLLLFTDKKISWPLPLFGQRRPAYTICRTEGPLTLMIRRRSPGALYQCRYVVHTSTYTFPTKAQRQYPPSVYGPQFWTGSDQEALRLASYMILPTRDFALLYHNVAYVPIISQRRLLRVHGHIQWRLPSSRSCGPRLSLYRPKWDQSSRNSCVGPEHFSCYSGTKCRKRLIISSTSRQHCGDGGHPGDQGNEGR